MRGALSGHVSNPLAIVRQSCAAALVAGTFAWGAVPVCAQSSSSSATKEDTARLKGELDIKERATRAAIEENAQKLFEVRAQIRAAIKEMLADAHVLADGRRVFKSKDGLVYDQDGRVVPSSVVAPRDISDRAPPWEVYEAALKDQDFSGGTIKTGMAMLRQMPSKDFEVFVTGMIEGMAYARFRKDTMTAGRRVEEGMNCIRSWYHDDPRNFIVVTDAIRQHPQYTAWVVLGVLVKKACGE